MAERHESSADDAEAGTYFGITGLVHEARGLLEHMRQSPNPFSLAQAKRDFNRFKSEAQKIYAECSRERCCIAGEAAMDVLGEIFEEIRGLLERLQTQNKNLSTK